MAKEKFGRFKITDALGNVSFISVNFDKSKWSYMSSTMVPLALSNIAHNNAAELSFHLSDAKDLDVLLKIKKLVYENLKVEICK